MHGTTRYPTAAVQNELTTKSNKKNNLKILTIIAKIKFENSNNCNLKMLKTSLITNPC